MLSSCKDDSYQWTSTFIRPFTSHSNWRNYMNAGIATGSCLVNNFMEFQYVISRVTSVCIDSELVYVVCWVWDEFLFLHICTNTLTQKSMIILGRSPYHYPLEILFTMVKPIEFMETLAANTCRVWAAMSCTKKGFLAEWFNVAWMQIPHWLKTSTFTVT